MFSPPKLKAWYCHVHCVIDETCKPFVWSKILLAVWSYCFVCSRLLKGYNVDDVSSGIWKMAEEYLVTCRATVSMYTLGGRMG